MKTITLSLICSILFSFSGAAQTNDLPFWDFRSNAPYFAKIGLGYYFDNQNHGFSAFIDIDYSPTRDIFKDYGTNNPLEYYDQRIDTKLGLRFEIIRNLKIFNIKPDKHRPDVNSWTYFVTLNLGADFLFRKINSDYFKTSTEDVSGTVLGFKYSLINQHNTSLFKYLSNTNGRIAFKYRHLTDEWGGQFYLQNDFWVLSLLKKHIFNHDHGNTTEAGISLYHRYKLDMPSDASDGYYNDKVALDYWFQIITDRKIANNTSSTFARLGYYSVKDSTIFHGYHRIGVRYEHDAFEASAGVLIDDLFLGRNLQRWAHQGTNHRNLKQRKNFLKLIKKQQIYYSNFDFTKDNSESRKEFLEQCFYAKQFKNVIPSTVQEIKDLSDKAVAKKYKENPDLERAFKAQLLTNKYRFKKSKVQEPTALFPWESSGNYFYKSKVSPFIYINGYKRS